MTTKERAARIIVTVSLVTVLYAVIAGLWLLAFAAGGCAVGWWGIMVNDHRKK